MCYRNLWRVCSMHASQKTSVLPSKVLFEAEIPDYSNQPSPHHPSGPALSEGLYSPGLEFQRCGSWCPLWWCSYGLSEGRHENDSLNKSDVWEKGNAMGREVPLSQRAGEDGWEWITSAGSLDHWSAELLCPRPHSICFRFCGPRGLCYKYSTQLCHCCTKAPLDNT